MDKPSTSPKANDSPDASVDSNNSKPAIIPPPDQKSKGISAILSPQVSSYFVAGGIAGAASRTVVSPLERLKIIQYVHFLCGLVALRPHNG